MALPKRKHSKARGRKRRTHQVLTRPALCECPQCHKMKHQHMICPFCGYYAGREIVKIELKEKKNKGR